MSLESLRGKVVLVENVASMWALTVVSFLGMNSLVEKVSLDFEKIFQSVKFTVFNRGPCSPRDSFLYVYVVSLTKRANLPCCSRRSISCHEDKFAVPRGKEGQLSKPRESTILVKRPMIPTKKANSSYPEGHYIRSRVSILLVERAIQRICISDRRVSPPLRCP